MNRNLRIFISSFLSFWAILTGWLHTQSDHCAFWSNHIPTALHADFILQTKGIRTPTFVIRGYIIQGQTIVSMHRTLDSVIP